MPWPGRPRGLGSRRHPQASSISSLSRSSSPRSPSLRSATKRESKIGASNSSAAPAPHSAGRLDEPGAYRTRSVQQRRAGFVRPFTSGASWRYLLIYRSSGPLQRHERPTGEIMTIRGWHHRSLAGLAIATLLGLGLVPQAALAQGKDSAQQPRVEHNENAPGSAPRHSGTPVSPGSPAPNRPEAPQIEAAPEQPTPGCSYRDRKLELIV